MTAASLQKETPGCMPLDLSLTYKVADIALAEFGRKEMSLSENAMPGIMAVPAK